MPISRLASVYVYSPAQSSDMRGLYYQALTKCKFCKFFLLIFIQNGGDGYPWPHLNQAFDEWFRSALPSATRIGASSETASNLQSLVHSSDFSYSRKRSFRKNCGAMV